MDCCSSKWRFWQSACYSKRPTEGNVKLSWMNNVCKDIPEWHIIFKLAEMWSSKPNYSPNHTLTHTNTQTNTRQHCCYKDMRMSETLLRESALSSCFLTLSEFISQAATHKKSKNIYPLCKKCQFLNSISLFDIQNPCCLLLYTPYCFNI